MLILSDFHDYYDVVMKQGIDKTIIYHRKESQIDFEWKTPPFIEDFPVIGKANKKISFEYIWPRRNNFSVTWMLISFCGKFYPVTKFHRPSYAYDSWSEKTFYAYTYDEAELFIRKNFPKKKQKEFFQPRDCFHKKHNIMKDFDKLSLTTFFLEYSGLQDNALCVKLKAPIAVYCNKSKFSYDKSLLINCNLKQFQFYKVLDPYTAYQELGMYISGVLGIGEPKTVEISDRNMKFKKGFNQQSFRTDPGTRKPRWLKRKLRDD